jgi:alkylation response protein AidB-like acyl-CoA dehydrogenase
VDLTYTDDQRMLAESVRAFVARDWPTTTVRRLHDEPDGFSPQLWKRIRDLGWTAIAFPEEGGGLGGTFMDLAVVAEELGRGAVSTPLLTSTSLCAVPLQWGDGTGGCSELLPGLISGDRIGTAALLEPDGRLLWPDSACAALDDCWAVTGAKVLVPFASVADLTMLSCSLDGLGPALVALPTERDGVAVQRHHIAGGEPRFRLDLDGVRVTRDDVIAHGDEAISLLGRCTDVATVLQTAHTVGLCEGALGLAVAHARDREQFGRPIGSFQAVANRCVDMRVEIDAARLIALEAAWRLDRGLDAGSQVATAKAYANLTVRTVITHAHQVLGAMGFSTEHDLHLLTRAARAFEQGFGDHAAHLERIAVGLGL